MIHLFPFVSYTFFISSSVCSRYGFPPALHFGFLFSFFGLKIQRISICVRLSVLRAVQFGYYCSWLLYD